MKIGVYFNANTFKRVRSGVIFNELKYLVQEGIPEGVEIFVFSPKNISWWNQKIRGLGYDVDEKKWKPEILDFPDAVYDRATFPEKEKEIGHEVRKRLKEEYNIIFLNSKHYFDKWETHKSLSLYPELRSFLLPTEIYSHPFILEKFLNKYKTVYIKDSAGRLGRNIFKIQKEDSGLYIGFIQKEGEIYHNRLDLESLNDRITNNELEGKTLIIQKGVELARFQDKPFDIRILVQKNGSGKWEVVDKSIRVAVSKDSVVTNISAGGEAKKFREVVPVVFPRLEDDIEKQINTMSISICKCLEKKYGPLGELGIDAALDDKGKVWLLEVNGKPAKSCVHYSNDLELIHTAYSNIIKYFKYLATGSTQKNMIDE
ncbi:MAG: RimK domain protein ATP-grasp [Clostridiales bacterium]|jgi:hypothetical protein|nr:RimK domain protein ATP-grasp [Clostridiales bacterium]